MTPDPAPDHITVSIYADGSLLPFVISSTRMVLQMLDNDILEFELKTALLARGLLSAATLRVLLTHAEQVLQAGREAAAAAPAAAADAPKLAVDDENRLSWKLTLADTIALATANDFMASAYLTAFGEEMRSVQVEINGVSAAAYDAQMHETLGYLTRFQSDWGDMFGHYAGYQARMDELVALREEFVG